MQKPCLMTALKLAGASVTLTLIALTTFVHAQTKPEALPFRMKLPVGYNHRSTQGVDTRTGRIWKRGGVIIEYDMGGDLPTKDERKTKPVEDWKRRCSWSRSDNAQTKTDLGDVNCWIDTADDSHEKTLHVSFPDLTEFWAKVKNQHEIDEVLQIVLTYDPRI